MTDTIFALSSGIGRAAIAVVRISGPQASQALQVLAGTRPPARQARLVTLRNAAGAVLDRAVVLYFAGPRSETGEDIVELQLHGSRAVVKSVLDELAGMDGLRVAEPGEFARRALINGKMDLLDVEALADLIESETEAQRRQALEGGGSLLRGRVEKWRAGLLDIRADLEAAIDFSDEGDVEQNLDSQVERILRSLIGEMDEALRIARMGERVRDGFVVALCGPPNAGKSSLLNTLAGRDVAIVAPTPGTTRDRIEVALDIGGLPIRIVDTAGIREAADVVEQEGVRRALETAREAGLVLWLSPVDVPAPTPSDLKHSVTIVTKSDLERISDSGLSISVRTGEGIERLIALVAERASEGFSEEPMVLTRSRHVQAVTAARTSLVDALSHRSQAELCAESVRLALRSLEKLLGRIDVEDVLGEIFSRFCIGK